jgi:hypothetical protein
MCYSLKDKQRQSNFNLIPIDKQDKHFLNNRQTLSPPVLTIELCVCIGCNSIWRLVPLLTIITGGRPLLLLIILPCWKNSITSHLK